MTTQLVVVASSTRTAPPIRSDAHSLSYCGHVSTEQLRSVESAASASSCTRQHATSACCISGASARARGCRSSGQETCQREGEQATA
jgi:hypothetical protein